MAFFDDYTTAMEQYVDTYVQLEIINVTYDGDKLNVREQGQFDVRITNTGPLNMLNVSLAFTGLNETLVKGGGALQKFSESWVFEGFIDRIGCHGNGSSIVVGSNANGADVPQNLYFRAPRDPLPRTGLVEVSIADWLADFEHIHASHSRAGASAILELRVVAA